MKYENKIKICSGSAMLELRDLNNYIVWIDETPHYEGCRYTPLRNVGEFCTCGISNETSLILIIKHKAKKIRDIKEQRNKLLKEIKELNEKEIGIKNELTIDKLNMFDELLKDS